LSASVFYNSAAEIASCSNVFKVNGTPKDPTTATLVITDPAGVQTTYTWPTGTNLLTHVGAVDSGALTQNVPCSSTVPGIWSGVWTGTGAASDVAAFTWVTQATELNRNYCTSDELKSRLQIGSITDDYEISLAVAAASRAIDRYCGRCFYRVTATLTYVPGTLYDCCTDDLVSVTTLATDPAGTTAPGGTFPVTWPTGSWQLKPYNPGDPGEPWPYTSIHAIGGLTFPWVVPQLLMRMDRVQVTGVFGWPAVPLVIRQMSLQVASEVFRSKDLQGGGAAPGEFAVSVISSSPFMRQALQSYCKTPFLAA
jgi:hypothetical protein